MPSHQRIESHKGSISSFSSPAMTDRSRSRSYHRHHRQQHGDSTTVLLANSSFGSDDLENEDLDISSYSLNITTDMLAGADQKAQQAQGHSTKHSVPSSSEKKRRAHQEFLAAHPDIKGKDDRYRIEDVMLKPKALSFEPMVPQMPSHANNTAVETSKLFHKMLGSSNSNAAVHTQKSYRNASDAVLSTMSKSTSFLRSDALNPYNAPIFDAHRSSVPAMTSYGANPLLSPTAFNQNLARIREENNKLRLDISKFKNKMEVSLVKLKFYNSVAHLIFVLIDAQTRMCSKSQLPTCSNRFSWWDGYFFTKTAHVTIEKK
jgi:hypothetical protein